MQLFSFSPACFCGWTLRSRLSIPPRLSRERNSGVQHVVILHVVQENKIIIIILNIICVISNIISQLLRKTRFLFFVKLTEMSKIFPNIQKLLFESKNVDIKVLATACKTEK